LRENLTSSSYGEGLETGREISVPRQSLTRQLLFKALKQTLKIKTFVGTSANAVRTQVWTALIAMLVLKYLQLKSTFTWSLSNLAALLRQ
jgi:IS4 transposase